MFYKIDCIDLLYKKELFNYKLRSSFLFCKYCLDLYRKTLSNK
ncbi:hypothetical protein QCK_3189 [Clostridioides difficile CD45]|uniref:Uncharacterized protein n=1 Tax=Clostridioides difficile TaxID=1496 RepID=A0A069ALR6_CLODI|nr:hypothetical protein QAY_2933 [Clostridioides difficile CD18]EQE42082.1 hypothetical protein QCC_2956 [Clostridioides difficile CD41]EQE52357.1 hypothetical protein QCG_3253 [Clostridioides difficile CD43]EQE60032.1 hypothetical protein QCK_3189 [Clostridioides difficile CD45]EQE68202.1 hypothetical protein QCO_2992 [Clostridioides difficile CD47]EQE76152.1 hypothetical protein QCS_2992 [Clostridioides difficile CD51]EQF01836.1 hypothetical protein QEK_3224 [Clostridioides difficile CD131]